jgi:putative copper export protein
VRFGHVLGVSVWLGGMIFLGAVAIPVVRAGGDRAASRRLVTSVARRFAAVGGAAWLLILGTGFALLHHRHLTLSDLPHSDYGRRVLAKICLLAAIGVAALLHGLWQGPRVRRAEAEGREGERRRWALVGGLLDGFMLLATLAALWLATSLVA